jgi:hypothetical protein
MQPIMAQLFQNSSRSIGRSRRETAPLRSSAGAFTLVEVLLAMVILALLVVMVSQMVGSVATGAAASGKRISADDEARLVFDRMAGDFAGMIIRPDVDPRWVPSGSSGPPNDAFYFLSQAPASFANTTNSQIALIGYTVNANGLSRSGLGLGWDDLTFTNGPVSLTGLSSSNLVTIAPSVLRMEYTLLMKPGSTNNNGTTNGANVYSQTNIPRQSMQDVAGVVVALVILDQASRNIVNTNTLFNQVQQRTNYFGNATNSGIPVGTWITMARTIPVTIAPKGARDQIRVYQRYFPLNR